MAEFVSVSPLKCQTLTQLVVCKTIRSKRPKKPLEWTFIGSRQAIRDVLKINLIFKEKTKGSKVSKLFELIKLQFYTVPATFIFDSLKS